MCKTPWFPFYRIPKATTQRALKERLHDCTPKNDKNAPTELRPGLKTRKQFGPIIRVQSY